jgi:hypothetical protein
VAANLNSGLTASLGSALGGYLSADPSAHKALHELPLEQQESVRQEFTADDGPSIHLSDKRPAASRGKRPQPRWKGLVFSQGTLTGRI